MPETIIQVFDEWDDQNDGLSNIITDDEIDALEHKAEKFGQLIYEVSYDLTLLKRAYRNLQAENAQLTQTIQDLAKGDE